MKLKKIFSGFLALVTRNARGKRFELDQKAAILVMRWLVVLLVIFMAAYSTKGFDINSPNYILAIVFVALNSVISLAPRRLFARSWFIYVLFLLDIAFVSAMIYFSEGIDTDFYLVYFLSIFMSSVGQSVGGAVPAALVAALLYGWLAIKKGGLTQLESPAFWIRLPFFFLVALFSSIWASQVKHERRQKDEAEKHFRSEIDQAYDEMLKINEQLKYYKEYNENVMASISSGVIVVDMNRVVTTFNTEAMNILLIVGSAVIGKRLNEFSKLTPIDELLRSTMETGDNLFRQEMTVKLDNRQEKVISISTSLLHAQTTRVNGAIAVFSDLSKTKSLEQRVLHSEKLAILGEMAAVMAHEIRNPLNSIAGFAQLLQLKVDAHDPRRQFVDIMVQESFRIDALISDILDFAHQKKTVISDIDFAGLAGTVVSAKRDDAARALPLIRGDSVRLERVLLNLVNNALDATPPGGRVAITIKPVAEDTPGVEIAVQDTGCGIAPEHIEEIFKPFFTTKQTGTGLGLAIIQKIVEEHQGTLLVNSKPGEGATFTIFLPSQA